jgi:hypothetical protein
MNFDLNPDEIKVLEQALQKLQNSHSTALGTVEFNSIQNCHLKAQYLRELDVLKNIAPRLGVKLWGGPQE